MTKGIQGFGIGLAVGGLVAYAFWPKVAPAEVPRKPAAANLAQAAPVLTPVAANVERAEANVDAKKAGRAVVKPIRVEGPVAGRGTTEVARAATAPPVSEVAAPAPVRVEVTAKAAESARTELPPPIPAADPPAATPTAPRTPREALVPAGTLITVRLNEGLSTDRTAAGHSFRATLDHPLVVNSMVIAERGTVQEGKVIASEKGGRPAGRAMLSLELTELSTADGQKVAIKTETFVHQGQGASKAKNAAKIGAGAAIGAAIGAIAGGGQGAAIGAAIGGAAGTGTVLVGHPAEAELAPETRISFRLKEPLKLTEKID